MAPEKYTHLGHKPSIVCRSLRLIKRLFPACPGPWLVRTDSGWARRSARRSAQAHRLDWRSLRGAGARHHLISDRTSLSWKDGEPQQVAMGSNSLNRLFTKTKSREMSH